MKIGSILVSACIAGLVAASACAQDLQAAEKAYENNEYATARKLLEPLARAGNAVAQLHLGYLYLDGHGGPVDTDKAMAWFSRLAEQNDGFGQDQLAHMYFEGRGSPVDYGKAYFWASLADQTRRGPARAEKHLFLEGMRERLTSEQAAAIDKDVAAWRDKHPLPLELQAPPLPANAIIFPSIGHPDVFDGPGQKKTR